MDTAMDELIETNAQVEPVIKDFLFYWGDSLGVTGEGQWTLAIRRDGREQDLEADNGWQAFLVLR